MPIEVEFNDFIPHWLSASHVSFLNTTRRGRKLYLTVEKPSNCKTCSVVVSEPQNGIQGNTQNAGMNEQQNENQST